MYQITDYTKSKARQYNVTVKPSTNSNKKIDVFKNNKKIASVGSINYKDYGTFLKEGKSKQFAEERKKLYKTRHKNDRNKVGSNGWYADKLLW